MAAILGNKIKMAIFGQSHAEAIGVVIYGIKAGEKIDTEKLQKFMERRSPGKDEFSTPRKEADEVVFVSGLIDGVTCGAPICAMIKNTNIKKNDYDDLKDVPRPGHSDFTAFMKFGDEFDHSGGGQFSGRMTAPMCIAGGIAKQLLEKNGIEVTAAIDEIAGYQGEDMYTAIRNANKEQDSVGGIISCLINGIKPGLGDAMFDGIEGNISRGIFGIPAVKGIEFGSGFSGSRLKGSENNDEFVSDGDKIITKTNKHGGILGGISSGMPISFRVAIKPTPSIGKVQNSVNIKTKENVKMTVKGRHDPCIVPRAVPVVEAIAAFVIYDMIMSE
ncbi:MAG: chorismate synthase [Peptostreptococcaceae bacterium]|nr:chorismate synthase [Peptostreptococcaceae bacterium]